jgi:hypothetical protein
MGYLTTLSKTHAIQSVSDKPETIQSNQTPSEYKPQALPLERTRSVIQGMEQAIGRAIAQAVNRRLPRGGPGWRPGQVMWDFWWTK